MKNIILLSDCCGATPLGEVWLHEVTDGNTVVLGERASGLCSRCEDNCTFSGETERYWLRDHPEVTIERIDGGDEDRHDWLYEVRNYGSLLSTHETLKKAISWSKAHQLKASYNVS